MIPQEKFATEIFDVFNETFNEVIGIYLDKGTSLFETLATISAEEASQPVSATCASIAAQVDHVRFYLDVLENSLLNREIERVDWGEIWRTTEAVSAEEWEAIQARLRETYQRIDATMKTIEDWGEADKLAGALAMVVHTAYHLGEIRQALCTVKQA